jgi:lipoprotein-anchoring transpeptidase ErfK/SrfK
VIGTFSRTTALGSPQVFVIQGQAFGDDGLWYRVRLPVRPNGTTGFIPADRLSLSKTSYRLALNRKHFRLEFFKGCELLKTFRVGIGTGETPTPVGQFYLVSLLKLPAPNTVYGTYAYGLSGFSDILKTWKLGGIVGLHGTNDPASVGRRSSHGCIRMLNRDIAELVRVLPLGTPIEIT